MTQQPKDWILDSDRADILNREQREWLEREQAEIKQMHENAVNAVTQANFDEMQAQISERASAQQEIDERTASAQERPQESDHIQDGRYIAPALEPGQATPYHEPGQGNHFVEATPEQESVSMPMPELDEQPQEQGAAPMEQTAPEPEIDEREARKQAVLDKLRADREAARENER